MNVTLHPKVYPRHSFSSIAYMHNTDSTSLIAPELRARRAIAPKGQTPILLHRGHLPKARISP
jgi:hypothetical protein